MRNDERPAVRALLVAPLLGSAATAASPETASAQTVVPNHGADGGYGAWYRGCWPGYIPQPMDSSERVAFYQAMVFQQMIQRQMLLEQIAGERRRAKRELTVQRCQRLREEEAAKR